MGRGEEDTGGRVGVKLNKRWLLKFLKLSIKKEESHGHVSKKGVGRETAVLLRQ